MEVERRWGPLKTSFALAFCLGLELAHAVKVQFFIGLGNSISSPKLATEAKNQMTKNTSSVNAQGGYYYNQEQLGTYSGNVGSITSAHAGVEATLDKREIFTIRGFVLVGYSNSVNFGSPSNIRNGNLRKCGANELPSLENICYRDKFPTSQPGTGGNITEINFNQNPGFAKSIASNALMMNYGVGADIGFNIPVSLIVEKTTGFKIISLRVGTYIGGGYQFTSYSVGTFNNQTYSNTTSTATIKENDKFYVAGGGWFIHWGVNVYLSRHMRFDLGLKLDSTPREGAKWYTQNSTQTGHETSVFAQQLLVQNHSVKLEPLWHFNLNLLF